MNKNRNFWNKFFKKKICEKFLAFFHQKNEDLESKIRQKTKKNRKVTTRIDEKDSKIAKTSKVC